jgi:hypothetical protein
MRECPPQNVLAKGKNGQRTVRGPEIKLITCSFYFLFFDPSTGGGLHNLCWLYQKEEGGRGRK